MKTIPLTRGYATIVDDDVYEWASQHNWYAWTNTTSGNTYAARRFGETVLLLHRAVMSARKGDIVDHKDGNTLDNQRSNLRNATHAQNMRNRRIHPKNPTSKKSQFKGVCWDKKRQMWKANITIGNKTKTIGCFASEKDAARAYDAASIKLSGAFAAPNFVDGKPNPRVFCSGALRPRERRPIVRRSLNKTGFRGVVLKHGSYYAVTIRTAGRNLVFGHFNTAKEAALAYDAAARKYHGPAAILNFPEL